MKSLKELVAPTKTVRFVKYVDGDLHYVSSDGFAFTVPVADIGTATFLAEDRAMLFMRYIRKELDRQADFEKQIAEAKASADATVSFNF